MLPYSLKMAFSKSDDKSEGDISHFQALMTALAATVGTGNVVGVATAVVLGGPGAVLWMWMTALVGMATKYSEGILGVKYRQKNDKGEMSGSPMYYLEHGLGQKWLGVLFAFFAVIAPLSAIGVTIEAYAASDVALDVFTSPTRMSGTVTAALVGLVVLGGLKSPGGNAGILV